MNLKICKLHPDAIVPQYATEGAACFDIHAIEPGTVTHFGATTFRTGLAFEVPEGYALMIYSRSGQGFKNGHRLANCVGVLDSDYRGELMVRLHNDKPIGYEYDAGDRIAQAMLIQVPKVEFEVVEQLSLTDRGEGGFGHTGK